MIVYCFKNNINEKRYIGTTKRSLAERWRNHLVDVERGSKFRFHAAIRKHGDESFTGFILEECSSIDEMMTKEKYYIELFHTTDYEMGYNMSSGGLGSPGWFMTDEIRQNMCQGTLGRKHSESTKKKMKESAKHRSPISKETRAKISDTKRGEKNAMFGIKGDRHPRYGKKHTEESKRKISESQKKRLVARKILLEQTIKLEVELKD